jgi:hypothetical protein
MTTKEKQVEKTVKFENLNIHSQRMVGVKDYFDMAKICLNSPSDSLSIDEIRSRIELIDLLSVDEKSDLTAFVYLNAKQLNKLISITSQTKWIVVDKVIIEFADYVTGLKELL